MLSRVQIAIFAALTLSISSAYAEKPSKTGKKGSAPTESSVMTPSATIVVRDKETGQLRAATAKEAAAIRKMAKRPPQKISKEAGEIVGSVQQLDDGTKSLVLDPSKLQLLNAAVGADGELIIYHEEQEQLPEM